MNRWLRVFIGLCAFHSSLLAAVYYASPGDDLQARIEALAVSDTLYLNEGTYSMGDAVRIGPGYTALPSSEAERITVAAAPGATARPHVRCTTSGQNIVDINNCGYWTFKGIEFSGGSSGFKINSSYYVTIEDCYVHDTASNLINLKYATHHITVRGCEIARPGGTGECFYIGSPSDEVNHQIHHCLIEKNLIHSTRAATQGDGVELKYMTYANTVRDNVLYDLKYPGVFVYGHPTYTADADLNVVEGNVIFDVDDNGIQVYGCAIIRNNIVFNTAGRGVEVRRNVDPVRQVRIVNNTFWACHASSAGGAITLAGLADASGVVIANNCVHSTVSYALVLNPFNSPPNTSTRFYANEWYSEGHAKPVFINQTGQSEFSAAEFRAWLSTKGYAATDVNNTDQNPLLTNPSGWDFYPQSGSPVIDRGTTSYAPTGDFDGVTRDAAPDCGAYEWTASGGPLWDIGATFKGTAVGPENPGPPGGGSGGGCSLGVSRSADVLFWAVFLAFLLFVRQLVGGRRAAACSRKANT